MAHAVFGSFEAAYGVPRGLHPPDQLSFANSTGMNFNDCDVHPYNEQHERPDHTAAVY